MNDTKLCNEGKKIIVCNPPKSVLFFFVSESDSSETKQQRLPFFQVIKMLWSDGISAYSNSYTLKWSLWVVISTCVNYQVNRIERLFIQISILQGNKYGAICSTIKFDICYNPHKFLLILTIQLE